MFEFYNYFINVNIPKLSLLIWTPIVGSFLFISFKKNKNVILFLILLINIILLFFTIYNFDFNNPNMQFIESLNWIKNPKIFYKLGIDSISLWLIILTLFTSLISIFISVYRIKKNISQYIFCILLLQGINVGVFCSLDSFLFYCFWELSLIPIFILIGIWGSNRRSYASIKLFLFTLFGSVLMLISIIYLGNKTKSFLISDFYNLNINNSLEEILIFLSFFIAFSIKVPIWPFHIWLPDAHTEAPLEGSVILASILLKMGAYGIIRFTIPMFHNLNQVLSNFIIFLSLINIIYISIVTFNQKDIKRLIAYSSISHMGYVIFGFFLIFKLQNIKESIISLEGAIFILISHAFVSSGFFISSGYLYERVKTREIKNLGGILKKIPVLSSFIMLFAISNICLPGTSGFIGEFMILLSSIKYSFIITLISSSSMIFTCIYTLYMIKNSVFGRIKNIKIYNIKDLRVFEIFPLTIISIGIIILGFYPNLILKTIELNSIKIINDSVNILK